MSLRLHVLAGGRPRAVALFDTGCHPDVATEPFKRWGGLAKAFDDVDLVLCSHLHMDHCGASAFFRRATCIVHARELATARDPKSEAARASTRMSERRPRRPAA